MVDAKKGRSSIMSASRKRRFQQKLLHWYDRNRRDLPWRRDRNPYRVWISEVMLQQTRVGAVIEHYQRFLRRFPTVNKLATARGPSVLAAWSGLGYYRRARMLHATAKTIAREHGGRFPRDASGLRQLPGIGRYTAAAIASIAFGEPVAVADGNVERVVQRVSGKRLAGEEIWQTAKACLSRTRPGDFNQAMMELGATICLPQQPKCSLCPVFAFCASRGALHKAHESPPQKQRGVSYALICRNGFVFLVQRPAQASLMPGMWELPEVTEARGKKTWLTLRHSITVTDYLVRVLRSAATETTRGKWVRKDRLTRLPLTGLARKILRAAEII
jgi:A/G-specific adenine glycosylase